MAAVQPGGMDQDPALTECPLHSGHMVEYYDVNKAKFCCERCRDDFRGTSLDCSNFTNDLYNELVEEAVEGRMSVLSRYGEKMGDIRSTIAVDRDELQSKSRKLRQHISSITVKIDEKIRVLKAENDLDKAKKYVDNLNDVFESIKDTIGEMFFSEIGRVRNTVSEEGEKIINKKMDKLDNYRQKLRKVERNLKIKIQQLRQLEFAQDFIDALQNNLGLITKDNEKVFKYCFCKLGIELGWFSDYVRKYELLSPPSDLILEAYRQDVPKYQYENVKFFDFVEAGILNTVPRYVTSKIIKLTFNVNPRERVKAAVLLAFGASNKRVYVMDIWRSDGHMAGKHPSEYVTQLDQRFKNVDFDYYNNVLYFFTDEGLYGANTSTFLLDTHFSDIAHCRPEIINGVRDLTRGNLDHEEATGRCIKLFTDGCRAKVDGLEGFMFVNDSMRAAFFSYSDRRLRLLGRDKDVVRNILSVEKPFGNTATPLISMLRGTSDKCIIFDPIKGRPVFETDEDKFTSIIIPFNKNPNYKESLFVHDGMFWINGKSFRPPFLLDGYKSIIRVYKDVYMIYMSTGVGAPYLWYYMKIKFDFDGDPIDNILSPRGDCKSPNRGGDQWEH